MAAEGSSNPQSPPAEGSWQAMLDAVVPAVVALQVTAVRSFQDDHAGAHGGTGFVVDAGLGLLLTNRHVCTCGPERTTATFVGCPAMEEVAVRIAYVDPVHDFAFLRFDPDELQQTPPAEVALEPSGCRVGEEIRVVGNDSLEKLQILSGTVARIDRNPPDLAGDYHDENTFYALASSGTRGGSSGSPVLNRRGRAIALNSAATNGTMHAFYLPLHRVARALKAVRLGHSVPRGTLCTALAYASFPEVLRLGVSREFVSRSVLGLELPAGGTFSKATPPGGMLQVRRSIPGTPAAKALQPGDVLLELNGSPCVDFVCWDQVLDASVGSSVKLAVCRSGERVEVELEVQDQHDLVPHSFMELGLGVFHEVPYQTAQKHNIPLCGVYVAQAGFVFGESVPTDGVILDINGNPCDDLRTFEDALQHIPNKEYFTVGWMVPKNSKERAKSESVVKMQRHWYSHRAWALDRRTRVWAPRTLGPGPAAPPLEEAGAAAPEETHEEADNASQDISEGSSKPEVEASPRKRARKNRATGAVAALAKSICSVVFRTLQNFDMDLVIDGDCISGDTICCQGSGVILNSQAGLVLTDRFTVPQPLGDIEVSLGNECRSASVLFMHPEHSLIVLQVEPAEGRNSADFGRAAIFEEDVVLEPGDECEFLGVDTEGRAFAHQVRVQAVRLGDFPRHWPPRWHEQNLEAIILADNGSNLAMSGVLCDSHGRVQGLQAVTVSKNEEESRRLGYGIPVHAMLPLVRHFCGQQPSAPSKPLAVPSLEVTFCAAELAKLRRLPARLRPSNQWLSKLAAAGGRSGTALKIERVSAAGPCDKFASEGDLLVAVCGEVVATAQAVEAKLQEAAAQARQATMLASNENSFRVVADIPLTILRRGKERQVRVKVPLLPSDGTTRILCWHGLVLRETPRAAREFGPVPAAVYISQTMLGSPGEANGIEGEFLLAVDGVPTSSLDDVVAAAERIEERRREERKSRLGGGEGGVGTEPRRHVRVETADSSGRRFVRPLEPDPLFWPLFEMSQNAQGAWDCDERAGL